MSTSASFSAGLCTPTQVPVLETYPLPGCSEIIVTLTREKNHLSWEVASVYTAPFFPSSVASWNTSSPVLARPLTDHRLWVSVHLSILHISAVQRKQKRGDQCKASISKRKKKQVRFILILCIFNLTSENTTLPHTINLNDPQGYVDSVSPSLSSTPAPHISIWTGRVEQHGSSSGKIQTDSRDTHT